MISKALTLFLFGIFYCVVTHAGQSAVQNKLALNYAQDANLCGRFLSSYSSFSQCDLKYDQCFVFEWNPSGGSGIERIEPLELATNQYNYTSLHAAYPEDKPYAILYLDRFQGDRHPRLVETWKVDAKKLAVITADFDSAPLTYERWVERKSKGQHQAHSKDFQSLLLEGERFSDDDSAAWLPVFSFEGTDYAVERQCDGEWIFGAYKCRRISKLSVKRIAANQVATTICEFSKPKKR